MQNEQTVKMILSAAIVAYFIALAASVGRAKLFKFHGEKGLYASFPFYTNVIFGIIADRPRTGQTLMMLKAALFFVFAWIAKISADVALMTAKGEIAGFNEVPAKTVILTGLLAILMMFLVICCIVLAAAMKRAYTKNNGFKTPTLIAWIIFPPLGYLIINLWNRKRAEAKEKQDSAVQA